MKVECRSGEQREQKSRRQRKQSVQCQYRMKNTDAEGERGGGRRRNTMGEVEEAKRQNNLTLSVYLQLRCTDMASSPQRFIEKEV